MSEARMDQTAYEMLKWQCERMLATGSIDQAVLGYFITVYALQNAFLTADTTGVGDAIERQKMFADQLRSKIEQGGPDMEQVKITLEYVEDLQKRTPELVKEKYERYICFCEGVIAKLLVAESFGKSWGRLSPGNSRIIFS